MGSSPREKGGIHRPLLLDLFCGAGGCAVGYHRAGFDVIGVDRKPQPRYPFRMVVADALAPPFDLRAFDAIHASPPCQRYSVANRVQRSAHKHPDLVDKIRDLLNKQNRPWIIENVVGAPLCSPALLCGQMFGLQVFRHRLFESSFALLAPSHGKHNGTANSHRWGKHRLDDISGGYVTVCGGGNCKVETARKAMGIDWMTKAELNEAIPPAYTEYVGRQLLRVARGGAA